MLQSFPEGGLVTAPAGNMPICHDRWLPFTTTSKGEELHAPLGRMKEWGACKCLDQKTSCTPSQKWWLGVWWVVILPNLGAHLRRQANIPSPSCKARLYYPPCPRCLHPVSRFWCSLPGEGHLTASVTAVEPVQDTGGIWVITLLKSRQKGSSLKVCLLYLFISRNVVVWLKFILWNNLVLATE